MSTDTGHNSTQNDATWTGNAEQMIDFGHRALHLTTLASKEVIEKFYNISASYSFYSGYSTGGLQGWNEVQKFPEDFDPEDFDGVLVGAPANWMTHRPGWDIRVALEQFPTSKASYIPATMWSVIHQAVVSQCDGLDGVIDNLVSDPSRFHPEMLACGGLNANASTCLSAAQISNLHRIYTPWWGANNSPMFDGLAPGSEVGFSFLFNGATPQFGIDFFTHAVVNDSLSGIMRPSMSPLLLLQTLSTPVVSMHTIPDLRPFQQKGSKVIEYHGWQDPVIPSAASGTWYDKVLGFYEALGKVDEVESFYRLFMVPGMRHCSGGDGAWVTDSASQSVYLPAKNNTEYSLLYSLVDWVENENSSGPRELIGTKYLNDDMAEGVQFTRSYCRWRNIPVYEDEGDVNLAQSWRCLDDGVY